MIQNNVIRSDDPQAVEKLQAKLDKLTKQHARMKEINAYFKKHATALGCPGLSDAEAAKLDERVQNSYSWEKQPYANIKRICFSGCRCGSSFFLCWPAVLPSVFISVCGMCWVRKRSAGCVSSARLPLLPWAL